MSEDLILTFTGDDADVLRTVISRTNTDLEQYLFDNLWEDFRNSALCIWEDDARTADLCNGCDYSDRCKDAIKWTGTKKAVKKTKKPVCKGLGDLFS